MLLAVLEILAQTPPEAINDLIASHDMQFFTGGVTCHFFNELRVEPHVSHLSSCVQLWCG